MIKIAFDVDGTLIHQDGPLENTPRYEIIQMFTVFKSLGNEMYIWSGGGVEYAEEWAQKLGLDAKIIEKGSIPVDIAVDDVAHPWEETLGKVTVKV